MGQQPKKYHVNDRGDVYRVNDDGSFTEMGNAENFKYPTVSDGPRDGSSDRILIHRLVGLEKRVEEGGVGTLSRDEAVFLARNSHNVEILTSLMYYAPGEESSNLDSEIYCLILQRYQTDDTIAAISFAFDAGIFEDSYEIRMAMAQSKEPFEGIRSVLRQLVKDKNPEIREAALANPNYEAKAGGGCFGTLVALIATISLMSFVI